MSVDLEPIVVGAEVVVLDEVVYADTSEQIVVGGQTVEVEPFETSENGAFTAPQGKAYSPVNVAVPQTEVVPLSVSENGTIEAPAGTAYNPVTVDVPIKTEESLTIERNGTYTPETGNVYNRVVANVPNTYIAQDEGKVVNNGALTAQTARTVTQNGTVDTTLNNSVTVNVPTRETDLQKLIDRTITSIEIPSGTESIGAGAFRDCTNLRSVSIPSTITAIALAAFYDCAALLEVEIPNSVVTYGSSVFQGCKSLGQVKLSTAANTVPYGLFYGCTGLPQITIPSNVTSIGMYAFKDCTSLQNVYFLRETPPRIFTADAFSGVPASCVIHVPYSADHSVLNAYKTAANYPNPNNYTYVEDF